MHADIGGFLGFGEFCVNLTPAQFKLEGDLCRVEADGRTIEGPTEQSSSNRPAVQL